jgi:hypothetical protein
MVFAVAAKDNAIYGIIGEIGDFDLQQFIYVFCLLLGLILVFIMCFGMCVSVKRWCCPHWLFATTISFFMIFFLTLGIALIAIAVVFADQLDELCSSTGADSNFQVALAELYTRSDTFYCVTTNGCLCYTGATYNPADKAGSTNIDGASGTVTKVQECTVYLEAAYADYNVDFDDIGDIITYLDLFGDLESEFDCSGICTIQSVYYFSDSSKGAPTQKCQDPMRDNVLLSDVLGMGIAYVVTAFVILFVWFIQYGLCCREEEEDDESSREKVDYSIADKSEVPRMIDGNRVPGTRHSHYNPYI